MNKNAGSVSLSGAEFRLHCYKLCDFPAPQIVCLIILKLGVSQRLKWINVHDVASPVAQQVTNSPTMQGTQVDPLEKGMECTPVFLPGNSHG